MKSLNRVTLIGRLGKDPEIQKFDSGVTKASFSLATSESYVGKDGSRVEQTEWHNIVLWRQLADIAEKYLRKGKLVYLEGRLRTRSWEDKDAHKRYITEIEAGSLIMLDGVKSDETGNNMANNSTNSRNESSGNQNQPVSSFDDQPLTPADENDDLPF